MNEKAKTEFDKYRKIVDEHLDKYIEVSYPEKIYKSMRYSLLAGGKRLRPVISIAVSKLFEVPEEVIVPSACAIEMLHCQSLIHDDLPAMDNDDFRRGKPSNHKVFGEAAAILAGDAFLSYAPKIIIDKTPAYVNLKLVLSVLKEFFMAAGTDGIIAGQIVDIESEKKKISGETLSYLYEYKTAKLFKLAVRTGAILGNADKTMIDELTEYARCYGHAFQIYDDILDVTSTLDELGKTPGKDEKAQKSTYVSMYGLKEAKEKALLLCEQACGILKRNKINSLILEGVVIDIVKGIEKCS